jgi:prepilin-type N-terminal cleavage/methylation domain-containing protein
MSSFRSTRTTKGFTFVETLIASAIFLMISVAVYNAYETVIKLISLNKEKTAALSLAEELIERARNVPFSSIGVQSGLPLGIFPHVATYVRSGYTFQATTTVRSVDDPFDGTIGGTPNDISPADYKLFEMEIGCTLCKNFTPIVVTTTAAPKSLETTSGNGALFVRVIDANGQAVPDATVKVKGLLSTSTIDLTDLTNNAGYLQLVDVPPGSFAYKVSALKTGYSSSTTYASSDIGGSGPVQNHPTVSAGQVTQITFSLDKISSLLFKTVDETCAPVPNVPLTMTGTKKIGTSPDKYKWSSSFSTNSGGTYSLPNMEWDTYTISLGSGYVLGGSMPFLPLDLSPGGSVEEIILAKTPNPKSLLVVVKDASNGFLPLSDATVSISGPTSKTLTTNRGFFRQTDWSGGSGQTVVGDTTKFSSSDGNIDFAGTGGEVSLNKVFGDYVPFGSLTSSWFDLGVATTTLYSLSWAPAGQATSTGADSVKFQLESADDYTGSTTGLLGPDGTNATYYTVTDTPIPSAHTNKRYHRYKMFLSTLDASTTPIISDLSLTFGTDCVPHGQAYFDNLLNGSYDVTVSKSGYDPITQTVNIASDWQSVEFDLSVSP